GLGSFLADFCYAAFDGFICIQARGIVPVRLVAGLDVSLISGHSLCEVLTEDFLSLVLKCGHQVSPNSRARCQFFDSETLDWWVHFIPPCSTMEGSRMSRGVLRSWATAWSTLSCDSRSLITILRCPAQRCRAIPKLLPR